MNKLALVLLLSFQVSSTKVVTLTADEMQKYFSIQTEIDLADKARTAASTRYENALYARLAFEHDLRIKYKLRDFGAPVKGVLSGSCWTNGSSRREKDTTWMLTDCANPASITKDGKYLVEIDGGIYTSPGAWVTPK